LASYARSLFTLGIGQILSWVGAIVLLVVLPRFLGDVNLGKLTFAWTLTTLFGIIADLGVSTLLAKEIARDITLLGPLTKSVLLTRLPLTALAAAGALGFVWIAGYDDVTKQIVAVLCVWIVVGAFANAFGAALQGLQRMRALTVTQTSGKLLQAGLVAAVLLNGAGPLEVAVVSVLSTAASMAVAALALRGELLRDRSRTRPYLRMAVLGGMPFFVWQASLMVYGQVDFVLLSVFTHDAVVGWYATAYRLVMLPAFVPLIITTAMLPALSSLSRDPVQFGGLARRSLQLVVLATIPMTIGILLLPDKIIDFLGYPAVFTNSIVPMMLLAPHVPLAGVDTILGTVLVTLDRQRPWAMVGIAAAVLNPLGNIIAIPLTQQLLGNGAIGASVVAGLTELFMFVLAVRLIPRGVLLFSTVGYVGRCLAAGLVMAGAVIVVRDAPFLVVVAVGAAVYGLASLGLQTLAVAQLRAVWSELLGRRVARPATSGGDVVA
jgi:O-antigen/teichoic acid export membrane protein